MTLLEICQALAKNVGLAVPTAIVGSSERNWVEALQLANESGLELARRVNWGILQQAATLTGTGTTGSLALPADYMRLTASAAVKSGTSILRALTRSEWNTLPGQVQGTPRYYHTNGTNISFYPYMALGATVAIRYQSTEWASSGTQFLADDATPLVDSDLLTKGLIVRWRRQKGMDYADVEAEYEAALADYAGWEDANRLRVYG